MEEFLGFLRVYGIMTFCVLIVIAITVVLVYCILRMKQLEKHMESMEKYLRDTLAGVREDKQKNTNKQQRIFSENMANFSESVTNAILSLNEDAKTTPQE